MLLPLALLLTAKVHPADLPSDYRKLEFRIPMRDGVKLYTAVYVPKHIKGKHPILLERTPYSAGPYGSGEFADVLGSDRFKEAGYIFAEQDVRGQYLSEGDYVNIRPQLRPGESGIDESTDTYDTVDYLVKHVPDNNGAVGMWGISYPGFYAAVGAINSHPALKAISPQAPVSDWFIGDDFHHNGAFFLQDAFSFQAWFDFPRKGLEKAHQGLRIDQGSAGAYEFFRKSGPLANLDAKFLKGRIPYWTEMMNHGAYDEYWRQRSLPSHLKNVRAATLVVGGLFDAEDMWGALHDYQAIRKQNPQTPTYLVMGPWFHGMWAGGAGDTFGDFKLGSATSEWYREKIEFPFFEKYLRGTATPPPATATLFDTGANAWHEFPQWPPVGLPSLPIYLADDHSLSTAKPTTTGADRYENDPHQPTPYLEDLAAKNRPAEYMIADQRFAERRHDVVTYREAAHPNAVTVAGPIDVDLWVSTTGTDADLVVKVVDIWPDDTKETSVRGDSLAGYEQLIRADVMRGKFRDSFAKPTPFVPGQPTRVHFQMNDVFHTFRPGHRIGVQIQSSWFPLVDQNPNKFVDIYHAKSSDFQRATVTIHHDPAHPSVIRFRRLNP